MVINKFRNNFTVYALIFILGLGFALRLYRLDFQSIWWDEGHSILMASAPVLQIPTLPGMDVHPPGFFAALHLWMGLAGRSEFALRYFSVGFDLLTVALLIRFGRMLGSCQIGLWAGLLAAISPLYVAYAQEVRMYAMITFFALASVYFLGRLVVQNSAQDSSGAQKIGPHLLAYILATTAALYIHYFTLFLLCFENLLWLAWFIKGRSDGGERGKRLLCWFGSQLGIVLLFSPQLLLALGQITTYANPNLKPPSLLYYITHNWQAYTLGLTFDPGRAGPYLLALLLILVGGLGVHLGRSLTRPPGSGRVFASSFALLTWLIIPLTLYFIVLQRRPSYEPRYMMLVTPSIFLLFGLALAHRNWLLNLPGLVVAAIFVLGLHSYYTNPTFFKDDSAGVAQWLTAETTPNDIVFVDVPHPFHYYAARLPAPTRYLFVDIHTAAHTLNQEALGRDRLYWVTWWGSDTDPREVIPFLLQKQAGSPQGERQFRGYRVVWYALSNRPFSLPADLPPVNVNFDHVLLLDGLAYSQILSPGEGGWATLHFSQLGPMEVNYKLSLRLRAPDGRLLAQVDKPILNDRHFQTAAWPIDDPALNQAINVYTLPLNDSAYAGPLTLEAVVYNAETLASIAAYGVPTTNDDLVSAQIGEVISRK